MKFYTSNGKGSYLLVVIAYLLSMIFFTASAFAQEENLSLKEKIKKSVDSGLHFLRSNQLENGSWSNNVGVTSLVLLAYMNSPRKYNEEDDPFVRKGIEFILKNTKEDGSIFFSPPPSYNTALAMMALEKTGNPKYKEIIAKAQNYLVKSQSDEEEGYRPTDKYYGGIGYGGDERPDLSNLQFAVEALKDSGLPKDHPAWKKLVKFIERCQNRSETNDQPWAKDDGGFIYSPKETFVPDFASYGSMTFAGLKSLLFSNVSKDDPRIKSAMQWIGKNYSVEENPKFGIQSLYYYYHTMSKALGAYGEPYIVTEDGTKHDWYKELSEKIMTLQDKDGYWVNKETKYWEGNKDLVTAHAILAMTPQDVFK